MAEEVKKNTSPKPKKPRTPKPKAEPAVVRPEATEATEKFEEEVKNVEPIPDNCVAEAPAPVVESKPEDILEENLTAVEDIPEVKPELSGLSTEELSESFKDFSSSLEHSPVEIKKLNPYLPDGKSKWVAQIPTKTGRHILFKGSYAKASRAAENWNISRGLSKKVKEIRSN